MQKKSAGIIFIIVFGSLLAITVFAYHESLERYNIIVIMVDDLDVETFEILLENNYLPNLKKIILNNGYEFTNSFVTNSLCCPSRATFFTGQYSHNHHVVTNLVETGIKKFDDSETLVTLLQESGYRTGFVGKYLNFYGEATEPTYIPPGWDDWNALVYPTTYQMYEFLINQNEKIVSYDNNTEYYQTDILSKISQKVILTNKEKFDGNPFFISIFPMAPHKEIGSEECDMNYREFSVVRGAERHAKFIDEIDIPIWVSFNEDVSDKPEYVSKLKKFNLENSQCLEKIFKNRANSMLAIDDLIFDIYNSLKITGQQDNTIIIFTSDNGFLLGQHRLIGKGLAYEESIRVPLIIKMPDSQGKTIEKLVLNNDLTPTILDIANIRHSKKIDGNSLIPIMEDKNVEWRNKFLIENHVPRSGIHSAVRTTDDIYIEYEKEQEYYNLNNDPFQLNNIINCDFEECKSRIAELKQWLEKLKICSGEECIIIENKKI